MVIKIHYLNGRGWMPTLEINGKEVYRGEYRPTPMEAMKRAEIALVSNPGWENAA